jgi:mono/diheme cytochrome c family protein
MKRTSYGLGLIAFALMGASVQAGAQTLATPTYTAEQAKAGETVYMDQCKGCHGDQLDNGEFAAPLRGPAFVAKWGGKPLSDVHDFMTQQMPPTNPGGLDPETYANVLAFILSKNDIPASKTALPTSAEKMKTMAAPAK